MDNDLQKRLIDYAVRIIALAGSLPPTFTGNHIAGQIIRSGTSPAPNYAEAVSSESRNDFIHKIQIALKELRETDVWLKIIQSARLIDPPDRLNSLLEETNELLSILVASVHTARRNATKQTSGS